MNKSGYGSSDGPQDGGSPRHSADSSQYVLKAEQRILQLISARAPIAKILNEICYALDCQIGNMVSVVSLPDGDCIGTAEIAENAALFGLHVFFSTDIATDSGQRLGTLEMYSILSRKPSPRELPLIARAVCLAAIAVQRSAATCEVDNYAMQGDLLLRRFVAQQPDSLN
jgi:hypothetical protein